MRIEKKGPWYEHKFIPESLADFKQAIEKLCQSYGCFVTIQGVNETYIIDKRADGFVIAENVERNDYWRERFATLGEMAEKCVHIERRPLADLFGRIGIQTICDCA
jgi:hypothetical protein